MTDTEMTERKRQLVEQFRALTVDDVPGDPGQWYDTSYAADSSHR
jgi:hypothetical protein